MDARVSRFRDLSAYWYVCGPRAVLRAVVRRLRPAGTTSLEELPSFDGRAASAQARLTFLPADLPQLAETLGLLRESSRVWEISVVEALGTPAAPLRSWEILARGEFAGQERHRSPKQFVLDAFRRVSRLARAVERARLRVDGIAG